ncbi:MAG TPA: arylsulfatase [Bacteroidales bacterium]|nr:arylsulfatase [Bacteroidales bacterium]
MKLTIISGLAGLAVSLTGCTSENQLKKPNIIFILGDDLGYADIGCYGQKIIETPNIDALTTTGVKFTNYYSGSPVSAPSRCSLLTGKHSGHAFIRGNHEWAERGPVWDFVKMEEDPSLEGQYPIPAETVTFSKVLQQQGYVTGCVGKWGLGAPYTEGVPNKQGFDFFFGYNCQRQAHTYYPQHLWRNEEIVKLNNAFTVPRTTELDGDKDPNKPESYARYNLTDYSPALMLKEALGFLDSSKDKPFFLHFTTTIPHVPMQAPQDLVAKYHEKIGDEQPYLGDKGYFPCRYPMATYAAMVSYLDYQVGELVKKLKELGVYENTIIIFSSDNGPVITGGANSAFFNNAEPFNGDGRRLKGTVYEGGIHVPFIVSWPSRIKEARTTDLVCAAYDIFPTFCDLSGAAHPDNLDGLSLLPTIMGKGKQQKHEYLYWEFPEGRGQQAVRLDNWKGIRDSTKSGNRKIQLFDLTNDIKEVSDVASQHSDIVSRIEQIMEESHHPPEIERFNIFSKE